jgi:DNA-binding Lrp family transcriptional regulator
LTTGFGGRYNLGMQDLKGILLSTYLKRQALNSRYSRNAFARDLGVSPTALSQVMSGKRTFSNTNFRRVVDALCLPADFAKRNGISPSELSGATRLAIDTFSLMAEWHHFAILNLVEVDNVRTVAQMTKRLGLSKSETAAAVARLLKLRLLKREGGFLRRTIVMLDAGTDIPSEALRKHNREKMELAIASLEKSPLSERDISSLTVGFDVRKLALIKAEIKQFKERINKICTADRGTEVYALNIQFFPLSKNGERK